ncbi:hypothetical protein ACQKWADRAFT_301348 [Trichoderma austrokoningii]
MPTAFSCTTPTPTRCVPCRARSCLGSLPFFFLLVSARLNTASARPSPGLFSPLPQNPAFVWEKYSGGSLSLFPLFSSSDLEPSFSLFFLTYSQFLHPSNIS